MSDNDLIRRGDALAAAAGLYKWSIAAGEELETAIAALPPAKQDDLASGKAVTMGVKPLVWDGWVTCHEATATTGQYVVQDEGDEGWGMWTPEQPEDDHPHSFHPSIDSAKAAAQAEYEARILSALDMQPTVSPELLATTHDVAALVEAAAEALAEIEAGDVSLVVIRDLRSTLDRVKGVM